jgi:hypothetical protein
VFHRSHILDVMTTREDNKVKARTTDDNIIITFDDVLSGDIIRYILPLTFFYQRWS